MTEFIKKGNYYYRNNSDGTLTRVTPTSEGYFTWTLPDGKKVRSAKRYKVLPQLRENDNAMHRLLSKTGGTNNKWDALNKVLTNWTDDSIHLTYYSGRLNTTMTRPSDVDTKSAYVTYTNEPTSGNYVRAATLGDFRGFKPSNTRGRYASNPKYKNAPAVTDRFYTDTIYVPTAAKSTFDKNLGKSYRFTADSAFVNANRKDLNGTYDARNHYITFKKDKNGKPVVFMEDVFDTNSDFIDNRITPIIVNQTAPVVFTNDSTLLNRIPNLSNWFLNPRNISSNTQD